MSALNTVKKFFPKVKRVVDSKSNALIEVTQQDANSKGAKNHTQCAMAVACKRKFHFDGVIISRSVAYLIKGNKARRFKLPSSVVHEVVSFDRGSGFAPGKYSLSKVNESIKLGPRDRPQKIKNRIGKEKRFRHLSTNVRSVLGGEMPK